MITLILDTNVLMSGIFWSGAPAKILDAWGEKKCSFVLSPEILDEYIRVGDILKKKYQGVDVTQLIDLMAIRSKLVHIKKLATPISQDPDDDKFIATAIEAKCKLIISGDKDLLDVDGVMGIEIIKPSLFIKKYLEK